MEKETETNHAFTLPLFSIAALVNTRFGGPPPVEFIVTRPFVFLITDKYTGITLFAGNVISGKDLKRATGNPVV